MDWTEDQYTIFGADIGKLEIRGIFGAKFGVELVKFEYSEIIV